MNNDPYYNFCLEEIKFYTEKINEIIKEGLKDPKKNYSESGIINRKSGELVHEITRNVKSENAEKDISFYSCRKRNTNV